MKKMSSLDVQAQQEISEPVKNAIGIFLLFAIALAFFYPMLFEGRVIFYRDFQFITYPIRYFLWQSYQQGAIPYWTNSTFGGAPFMSTLHPGVFYPPSVFFFVKDATLALNLFYVFHFLVIGIFVFLLGRKWNLSWWASACCGVTGMLGGMIVASTLTSNYFLSSVWFPLVFWFYYQYEEDRRLGWFIGLVLAIFTQTLAACPEISVMSMLLLYLHAIVFTTKTRNTREVIRITTTLGLAVLFALGLSAFQLMPTAALLKHSFRQSGLDYAFHTHFSLPPAKLTTLVLTPGYDDYLTTRSLAETAHDFSGLLHTLYMGIFGFFFLCLGFLFRKDKVIGFWLVIFLVGVFFALGEYNPFYEYIYRATPFLDLFRYPEKYLFVSSIAAIFLLGFGLDALMRTTQTRQIKISTVLVFLILIFGAVSTVALVNPNLEPEFPLTFLIIFSVAYVLFYFGKLKQTVFAGLLFFLILSDLFIKDAHLLPLIHRDFYEEPPLLMDILGGSAGKYRTYTGRLDLKPDPRVYPPGPTRIAGVRAAKQQLYANLGMVFGVEHAGGVPGLAMDIQNHIIWYKFLIQSEPDRRRVILRRSNVKYWIDGDSPMVHAEGGFPVILPDRVKVLEDVLPRAFLVPKMRVPEEGQLFIDFYDKSFDPREEVLLNKPVEFKESPHFQGNVKEVTYSPNHVTVKTSQEGNGFLVLLDTFLHGWTVKVDGREQPILQAYGFYRAVQLEPGEHTLEFDYFPQGLKKGLIVSSIFLLILIALPFCGPIKRLQFRPSLPSHPGSEGPLEFDTTPDK
jgi:hypothetical protein